MSLWNISLWYNFFLCLRNISIFQELPFLHFRKNRIYECDRVRKKWKHVECLYPFNWQLEKLSCHFFDLWKTLQSANLIIKLNHFDTIGNKQRPAERERERQRNMTAPTAWIQNPIAICVAMWKGNRRHFTLFAVIHSLAFFTSNFWHQVMVLSTSPFFLSFEMMMRQPNEQCEYL